MADKAELIWLADKRVVADLEKARLIPPEAVDPEEALQAISLWKGSLIPPDRAGTTTSPYLPPVYQAFETARMEANALTFDDFVPLTIQLLENSPPERHRHCSSPGYLIIDEYQDINYGQ